MAILRSTQFYADNLTGLTVQTLYTVPSGHRIGLRGIQVRNLTGSSQTVKLVYNVGGSDLAFYTSPALGSVASASQILYVVFDAGTIIKGSVTVTGGANIILSGSLYFI